MHAHDVEAVFNLRSTGLEDIEPLATMAENVISLPLIRKTGGPNETQLRFLYEANPGLAATEPSVTPLEWASAVTPFKEFQSELSGVLDNLAKTDLSCPAKLDKGIGKYIPPFVSVGSPRSPDLNPD